MVVVQVLISWLGCRVGGSGRIGEFPQFRNLCEDIVFFEVDFEIIYDYGFKCIGRRVVDDGEIKILADVIADFDNVSDKRLGKCGIGEVDVALFDQLTARFGIVAQLQFYNNEDLARIVKRSAKLLNVKIDEEGAFEVARRSRGTPRIANRLLRRVRDYAQVKYDGMITREVADKALQMLDVDPLGFDLIDRKFLLAIIEKFNGGPVGIDNLAAAVGEDRETLEDVVEPYLIQQGHLQRTPRGRVATLLAYRHFGFEGPGTSGQTSSLF